MMYMDTCRLRLLASFDFLGCHVGSEVFAYTLKAGLAQLLHEIVGCVGRPRERRAVYTLSCTLIEVGVGGAERAKSQLSSHSVQFLYACILCAGENVTPLFRKWARSY